MTDRADESIVRPDSEIEERERQIEFQQDLEGPSRASSNGAASRWDCNLTLLGTQPEAEAWFVKLHDDYPDLIEGGFLAPEKSDATTDGIGRSVWCNGCKRLYRLDAAGQFDPHADVIPNRVHGHGEPLAPVLSESESDWRGTGRLDATPNRVLELEDDEEQRIVVGALEQYADTKRYTVAASTADRKMLDRQGAIAKSLAQRLT